MDLYRTWDGYVQEWITSGRVAALGGRVSYGKIIRECVRAFDACLCATSRASRASASSVRSL